MTTDPIKKPTPTVEDGEVAYFLEIARKYPLVILGTSVLGVLLSLFWTLRMPKIYEARATLTYDTAPVAPLGKDVEDVARHDEFAYEFYETQNGILQSLSLATAVVRKLNLDRDTGFAGYAPGFIEGAAGAVLGSLSVQMRRGTLLVDVMVRDTSPARAQLIANTIVDLYIERTIDERVGTTASALEWLNAQSDALKKQLETSELALHEFKRDKSVLSVSLEGRQNIVTNEIERISEALTTARITRLERTAVLEQVKIANREDPLEVFAPSFANTGTVVDLREKFRTTAVERDALATRYGPQHPSMLALDAQLTAIRNNLRREIDGKIAETEADLNQARAMERGLEGALAQANAAGLELNLQEIHYTRLNRERLNNEKIYGILLLRTAETDLTRMLRISHARHLDAATLPTMPVAPRVPVNLAVGAVLGLLLGVAGAITLARLDRTIRTAADAEALGLAVMGLLPSISPQAEGYKNPLRKNVAERDRKEDPARDILVHALPRSAFAECCRTIRTNLNFMSTGEPFRTLMITSAGPREGKTTVATNLAASLAQNGHRVLLVDTDLRRPRIHKTFGLPGNVGVSSILIGEHTLETAVRETVVPGLFVLPCGPVPPNPSEQLDSDAFRQLIADATAMFDKVVFDSPPLGAVTDGAIIAPRLDGTLFVAQSRQTSRDAAASALKQLRDVRATIFGSVLNNVAPQDAGQGYGGYYYYHGGYYGDDVDTAAPTNPAEQHTSS
jgi:capsular exopolysaccharide synthesis family protein